MPVPLLIGIGLAVSTVSTIISATGDRPTAPKVPGRDDPQVLAARRRALASTGGQGRQSTIIAGAKTPTQSLETESATLLGG